MKISIVYDNTLHPANSDLIADWGFSAFIEFAEKKILFDTGGNGQILMQNLYNLELDPTEITDIFISHGDFDHIGGLSHLLNLNQTAVIHSPVSFRGIRYQNAVKYYQGSCEIYPNIFSSGELGAREQSLFIKTAKGLVVISGCAHPGVQKILQVAQKFGKVYALIGGLHGFDQFQLLEGITEICATHCSKYKAEIARIYPNKYLSGGVGRTIIIS